VEKLRKEFPRLAIVVDFRDEWLSTTIDLVSFSRSERARRVARNAEASAVTNATAVVAVTEAARREIRARYPQEPDNKFQLIPNGFDSTRVRRSAPSPGPRPGGKIIVTHVGTVYASTDPTTLVEAVQSLPPEVKSRFRLRFIGHIEEPRFREALLQLGRMVELRGFLPQHEALAAMNETDYALLITHDPLNVAAKFYDYIGAGKPILATINPDGEVRRLLEELRAGWWAGSRDVEGIRRLFIEVAAAAMRCSQLTSPISKRSRSMNARFSRNATPGCCIPLREDNASAPHKRRLPSLPEGENSLAQDCGRHAVFPQFGGALAGPVRLSDAARDCPRGRCAGLLSQCKLSVSAQAAQPELRPARRLLQPAGCEGELLRLSRPAAGFPADQRLDGRARSAAARAQLCARSNLQLLSLSRWICRSQIGKALSVPVVVHEHWVRHQQDRRSHLRHAHAHVLREADFLVTVSGDLRSKAVAMGAPPETTRAVINGCDLSVFHVRDRLEARRKIAHRPSREGRRIHWAHGREERAS
jgi:hypothetical protein